ncbi:MAG: TIGR02300 family protein [Magnetospirillum sp.]|nr:TIGR02300 family protein [Magnetospirillum sp.]
MAKPEWGQKRTCTSCGCRFYDLTRVPVTCPKCGAAVETDLPFKTRRSSAPAEPKTAAPVLAAAAAAALDADDIAVIDDDEEAADGEQEGGEDDESGLIEDASDLGGDDEDMAEVMEHLDEEIEDEV